MVLHKMCLCQCIEVFEYWSTAWRFFFLSAVVPVLHLSACFLKTQASKKKKKSDAWAFLISGGVGGGFTDRTETQNTQVK